MNNENAVILSLRDDKAKLYKWLDLANFKKNEYFAMAEKAESDAIHNADLYLEECREHRTTTAQRDMLLAKLTHAATDYIDQNGCKPSWWTDDIVALVKDTTSENK